MKPGFPIRTMSARACRRCPRLQRHPASADPAPRLSRPPDHVGCRPSRAMGPRICRKSVDVKWLSASWRKTTAFGSRASFAAPRNVPRVGSTAEKTERCALAEANDRAHGGEAHRAHRGAVALPVTTRERVVREQHAPARLLASVARVELERERTV